MVIKIIDKDGNISYKVFEFYKDYLKELETLKQNESLYEIK